MQGKDDISVVSASEGTNIGEKASQGAFGRLSSYLAHGKKTGADKTRSSIMQQGKAHCSSKDAAAATQQPKSGPSAAATWPERSSAAQRHGPRPGARRPRAHLTALNYKQRSSMGALCLGPSSALLAEIYFYWIKIPFCSFPLRFL